MNNQDYTPLNNYNQPEMKAPKKRGIKKQTIFIILILLAIIIGVVLYFLLIKP